MEGLLKFPQVKCSGKLPNVPGEHLKKLQASIYPAGISWYFRKIETLQQSSKAEKTAKTKTFISKFSCRYLLSSKYLVLKIGKCKLWQIVVTNQSISKTAHLVLPRSTGYKNCPKERQLVNQWQGLTCLVWSHSTDTVAQIAEKVNAGYDRNTQCITAYFVCGHADQSEVPPWPLWTFETNGYMGIRTGLWISRRWWCVLMNHIFISIIWMIMSISFA